jgi:apolipoprotein N-acyltransferase
VRIAIAVVLFVIGVVWIGQGVGLIGGSFMTGQAVWAVIGALAVLAALMMLRGAARDRRLRRDER